MIDFCSSEDATKLDQDLDLVLQQLDILLSTNPHDVLGDPSYGSDFEKFLWDLNYSNNAIKRYTEAHLSNWIDTLGFNLSVDVTILAGEFEDIILLTITLSKDGKTFEKTYNI